MFNNVCTLTTVFHDLRDLRKPVEINFNEMNNNMD